MSNQPEKTNVIGGKQPRRRNNNNKINKQNFNKILGSLKGLKQMYDLSSPEKAIQELETNKVYKDIIDQDLYSYPGSGKLSLLEKMVGEKFLEAKIPDYDKQTAKKRLEYAATVYADDLSSLLGIAARYAVPALRQLAIQYGPKLIDWLYTKAKDRFQSLQAHGSGPGWKSSYVGEQTPLVSIPKQWGFDVNTVSTTYLASVFNPEQFSSLVPDQFSPALVHTTRTTVVDFLSCSDGKFLGYYYSDSAC